MIRQIQPLITEIGPEHTGKHFTADDFERLPGREGYRYELIEGVLHVSPTANPLHAEIQRIITELLQSHRNAKGVPVFGRVFATARVIVEADPRATTNPEPDVAAYESFPSPPPRTFIGVNPVLVVEVVSMGSHDKDYARNPELFERVSDIREYWVIDPTGDRERPSMSIFHRTRGEDEFERLDIPNGGSYESRNWPGLRIDLGKLWS